MIKDSDGDKTPSPNGYTFGFIENLWDVIKPEFQPVIEQFS